MGTPGVAFHALETLDERARTLAELSVILAEVGSPPTPTRAPRRSWPRYSTICATVDR
jgi:hypothetical protein